MIETQIVFAVIRGLCFYVKPNESIPSTMTQAVLNPLRSTDRKSSDVITCLKRFLQPPSNTPQEVTIPILRHVLRRRHGCGHWDRSQCPHCAERQDEGAAIHFFSFLTVAMLPGP
jgi:hypothetical protein